MMFSVGPLVFPNFKLYIKLYLCHVRLFHFCADDTIFIHYNSNKSDLLKSSNDQITKLYDWLTIS